MANEDSQTYPRDEAPMAWLIGCVIVAIVFYFSRKAGIGLLALLAIVWGGLWITTDRNAELQPSNHSVATVATSDSQLCPDPDRPVSVSLTNNANRPLESVSFSLIAKQRGSDPIIYRASHTSDKVIAPGETFLTCYGLNPLSFSIRTIQYDPHELHWSAEISLTRFGN